MAKRFVIFVSHVGNVRKEQIILLTINAILKFGCVAYFVLKFRKILHFQLWPGFHLWNQPEWFSWIWHFNRANSAAINKRSMFNFPWLPHLNRDPNWQVKYFTNIFLNIMSTFIPNEIKIKISPWPPPPPPPRITKHLKTLFSRLCWSHIVI